MDKRFYQFINLLIRLTSVVLILTLVIVAAFIYVLNFSPPPKSEVVELAREEAVVTDFIIDEGYELVVQNCTGCHSSKLVTQNRATSEGWRNTIKWMQETQNLGDLGGREDEIVAYLAKNYAPAKQGRRKNLEGIKWYVLEP
ncbi:MAG: cytochrome C [Bacteroidota bacterium]